MFRYYKIATIIPTIVIVVCYLLAGIADSLFELNITLTNKDVDPLYVLFYLVFIWLPPNFVLTIPILFNTPGTSYTTNLFSWFLLPVCWYAFLLLFQINSYKINNENIVIYSITIPYIIGLYWSFVLFQKDKKETE